MVPGADGDQRIGRRRRGADPLHGLAVGLGQFLQDELGDLRAGEARDHLRAQQARVWSRDHRQPRPKAETATRSAASLPARRPRSRPTGSAPPASRCRRDRPAFPRAAARSSPGSCAGKLLEHRLQRRRAAGTAHRPLHRRLDAPSPAPCDSLRREQVGGAVEAATSPAATAASMAAPTGELSETAATPRPGRAARPASAPRGGCGRRRPAGEPAPYRRPAPSAGRPHRAWRRRSLPAPRARDARAHGTAVRP